MNSLDLNKIKLTVLAKLRHVLQKNLVSLILFGSFSNSFNEGWSDIDLLIVVHNLDLRTKMKIARTITELENSTKLHHGINVITKEEFLSPRFPENLLEGKTLQALINLKKCEERILYLDKQIDLNKIYSPNVDVLKKYSLSNITMFLKRNRRTLTTVLYTNKNKKELLKKEIRASLIITKLAVQYFTGNPQDNYQNVFNQAKLIFPDFNFGVLEENFRLIKKWQELDNDKEILDIFQKVDSYIENFTQYVLEKAEKN
jgi:predicted nucleotidyltransferase